MKIHELLGLEKPIKGDVGIEIEVEGGGLVHDTRELGWEATRDGSLRGESMEYVLSAPKTVRAAKIALKKLRMAFKRNGSIVEPSNRCGVHVHVNCQSLTVAEVASFITTYLCFENTLVNWCGEDRVGNLFCLRAGDAPGLLRFAREFHRTGSLRMLRTDQLRYASINLKALATYGSLEFRSMRSDLTQGAIETWVDMLVKIREYAIGKNPADIVGQFSFQGPQDFFNEVLGEWREELNPSERDLIDGVRNAQEVAFV